MSTEKIIWMPTDDELFASFYKWLVDGTPESGKKYIKMFEQFLGKAKAYIKNVLSVEEKGLALNVTEETGNKLIQDFINAQWLLLKLPLKTTLMFFDADSFTHFIEATQKWRNNPEKTIGGFTRIITIFMEDLGQKYAIAETSETIKEKIEKVFA